MHEDQSARMTIRDKPIRLPRSAACSVPLPEIDAHLRASLLIRVHLRLESCASTPRSAATFGTGRAVDDLGKADGLTWRRATRNQKLAATWVDVSDPTTPSPDDNQRVFPT